jgi:hypothetical protein
MAHDRVPEAPVLSWLFGDESSRTKKFWAWFAAEGPALAQAPLDVALVTTIGARLNKVHRNLDLELGGPGANGRRMLAISAGGIRAMAGVAERVAAAAPEVAGWEIRAYRPPKSLETFALVLGGGPVEAGAVRVRGTPNGAYVDVTFCFPGQDVPERAALESTFLLLDVTLGERGVMDHIGGVEVAASTEGEGWTDLAGLRALVEGRAGPLEPPRS